MRRRTSLSLLLVAAAATKRGGPGPTASSAFHHRRCPPPADAARRPPQRRLRPAPLLRRPAARAEARFFQSSTRASRHRAKASGAREDVEEGAVVVDGAAWNPALRRAMGAAAGLGAVETAYLTWIKAAGQDPSAAALCAALGDSGGSGPPSSCGSVLTGPYSSLPVGATGIPLASLGLVAYSCVLYLAVSPLLKAPSEGGAEEGIDDRDNRVALTAVVTFMGVFSVFLVSLLLNVLHQSCAYCFLSAALSVGLAAAAWLGGALPPDRAQPSGALAGLGASLLAAGAAAFLYVGTPLPGSLPRSSPYSSSPPYSILAEDGTERRSSDAAAGRGTGIAAAGPGAARQQEGELPPPITTRSTSRALSIAAQLQALDARLYGAYWCGHCYDQKQALGREAMSRIPYIECSREGRDAQVQLCKDKNIPGYPTWEIRGALFPGEQALDELEEIVSRQQQQP